MACNTNDRCVKIILDQGQQAYKDPPFENHWENTGLDNLLFASSVIEMQNQDRDYPVCLLTSLHLPGIEAPWFSLFHKFLLLASAHVLSPSRHPATIQQAAYIYLQ